MDQLRRHTHKYKRTLWVLATAVLLMQMLPLHLHLHHSEEFNTPGISHAADMHLADTAADELHHGDAHVIDLSAETIVKSLDDILLVPLLFACLLSIFFKSFVRHLLPLPKTTDRPPLYFFLIFSPLRAPPLN